MQKVQQHEGPNESGDLATMLGTTYTYNYGYNQARPHAVTSINDGSITFRYDASGNMTARYDEEENSWRTLHWDAENRLVKTIDNEVATNYSYDAEGTRVTKSGSSGEVTYVDPAYVIRNNSITGKHVFVGNTRVASKMDVKGDDEMSGVYYYHADHLGSSSVVTGKEGGFHERIEYFPYGETWVEDKATSDGYSSPYRYTAKEFDPETGLYYFGARYYDARLSRWVSTDPALQDGKYFPKPYDFDTEHDFYWYLEQDTSKKLPGIGGVFNAVNLDVYHYGGNNPVKLVDPDGNANSYFGVIKGLFNGNFSPFKNRVQYECKAAVYHGKGQSHAYAAGTVAGIISELSGVELQPYALGVSGDYAGEFNNGLKFGKNSTKAIAYTNMARSILQKTGQGVAKDIFKDKESTLKFAEGFIIGMKEGVKPPIKKSNLKTPEEKAGYVVGSIIAELAKQQ